MDEYLLNRLDRECAQISARSRKGEDLKREVSNAIDSAAQNAADTCLEHGFKRDTQRWNAFYAEMFYLTLCMLMSTNDVTDAGRRWFARRGIVG